MIKAKELRSGNILSYYLGEKDCEWATTCIDWQDIKRCEEQNEEFNEDHKAILLTEEWLLKLGFENKRNRTYSLYYINAIDIKQDLITYHFFDDKIYSYVYGHGQNKTHSHVSVHQLQNLYFALTGEELTIKS